MCPCPSTLLKQKKREWRLTLLLGIAVPCGDVPVPGLFLDNIVGKIQAQGFLQRLRR